ncbi:unnamed protein product, partial [Trichogramma brassicae]
MVRSSRRCCRDVVVASRGTRSRPGSSDHEVQSQRSSSSCAGQFATTIAQARLERIPYKREGGPARWSWSAETP